MRYFVIAWLSKNSNGGVSVACKDFPSREWIISQIVKDDVNHQITGVIVITNIFEFKSKKDYKNFTKKE